MHVPVTLPLGGPLQGSLPLMAFSSEAYIAMQVFGRREKLGLASIGDSSEIVADRVFGLHIPRIPDVRAGTNTTITLDAQGVVIGTTAPDDALEIIAQRAYGSHIPVTTPAMVDDANDVISKQAYLPHVPIVAPTSVDNATSILSTLTYQAHVPLTAPFRIEDASAILATFAYSGRLPRIGGPLLDDLTDYTKVAGRLGTANDTILTTTAAGTGILYGCSLTTGNLRLRPNKADLTTGKLFLDGRIKLFDDFGGVTNPDFLTQWDPTATVSAVTTIRCINLAPILTVSSILLTLRGVSLGGTWTQITNNNIGQIQVFIGEMEFIAGTTGLRPFADLISFESLFTTTATADISGAAVTSIRGFIESNTTRVTTNATAKLTVTTYTSFQSLPLYTASIASSLLTITTRRGLWINDPVYVTTGGVTVTDNIGVDIDSFLSTSGNRTVTRNTGIRSALAIGTGGTTSLFINATGTAASAWAGLFSKYNNDTTAGNGMASVVANVALTGQTANIGSTTLFTPPTTVGTYRVSVYAVTTTAGNVVTISATIGWTDDNKAQTITTNTMPIQIAGAFIQSTFYIEAKSSAAITYLTTQSGALGTGVYSLYINVERLS